MTKFEKIDEIIKIAENAEDTKLLEVICGVWGDTLFDRLASSMEEMDEEDISSLLESVTTL